MAAEVSLTIGDLAARSGVSPSALRFYETRGLITSRRSAGNQRRYDRATLRRVAFVQAAQRLGLSLQEIADALGTLPTGRTPTASDWARLSRSWARRVDDQIASLQQMRATLDGCIGCGCLSLRRCGLFNAGDKAAATGAGARYLLGENSSAIRER